MKKPLVLILMGSDSDLPVVEEGLNFLREMGVTFKVDVSSAHRNPEKTVNLARTAREKGIEVIIAVAGLAAHLPGVVASHTTLPVIGVPIAGGELSGMDALLSIVQMPKGIPVATVAINSARNAAILACQILSIKHGDIEAKLEEMKRQLTEENEEKAARLKSRFPD